MTYLIRIAMRFSWESIFTIIDKLVVVLTAMTKMVMMLLLILMMMTKTIT